MTGRIQELLEADHVRLDERLRAATARPDAIDGPAFWEFRTGLLRHIGMEERILFPAVRQARGGASLPWMRRLREDHGALAALLVPTPTPETVARIVAILEEHNRLEEGPHGAYADCEAALGPDGVDAVLERLRQAPTPPPAAYFDGPRPSTLRR